MDLYLHTGGRSKGEWFPESIQGLFRASRTECQDDLDHIQACLPIAAQRGEGDEEGEGLDDDGLDGAGAAASARSRASGHNKRKGNKYERQEAELAAEAAVSKRARLNLKIQQERQRLESTKESGYHLRQNLDSLRAETQQYEDAIAQTKREMEMIQRETQILEERLAQSRSEYHWGLDQAERIRIEEEKIETHLREKLSTVNTQVNDVSDRVHQLRQLEEEFKLKDVRIQQLETEIAKYETQIALMDQLINKQINAGGAAASGAAASSSSSASSSSAAAAAASSPASSSAAAVPSASSSAAPATTMVGVVSDQPAPPNFTGDPALDAATAANALEEQVMREMKADQAAAAAAASAASGSVPMQLDRAMSAEAASAASSSQAGVIVVDTNGVANSPSAAAAAAAPSSSPSATATTAAPALSASSSSSSSVGPLLPIPSGPNPSLSELLASINSSTSTIAHLRMSLKLHEEQLESSNRHLIDRDRAMKYMQEQIERFSNLNHELNFKLKSSENLTLEERAKLDQSYKQILFGQKGKEEQDVIIRGYDEKLKVFEQLLNVADVRATSAEDHVAETHVELKASRMAAQILQSAYNKLMREYERVVHEKFVMALEKDRMLGQLHAYQRNNPGAVPKHDHSVSFDSNSSEPRSPHHLGAIKEEAGTAHPALPAAAAAAPSAKSERPSTLVSFASDGAESSGFGGINGLASPMALGSAGDHHRGRSDSHHGAEHHGTPSHLAAKFELAFGANLPPSALAAAVAGAGVHDDSASGAAQRALMQQNKELTIKLSQMTHHNTQLQVALMRLANRAQHKSTSPCGASYPFSPPSAAAAASSAAAAAASASPAAAAAASSASPHHPQQHAMKLESNGTHAVASSSPERAQAMDIDSAVPASAASASAVPVLSHTGLALLKTNSAGALAAYNRNMGCSSPLQTPRSPLPPLHPNKPVFQEEIQEL